MGRVRDAGRRMRPKLARQGTSAGMCERERVGTGTQVGTSTDAGSRTGGREGQSIQRRRRLTWRVYWRPQIAHGAARYCARQRHSHQTLVRSRRADQRQAVEAAHHHGHRLAVAAAHHHSRQVGRLQAVAVACSQEQVARSFEGVAAARLLGVAAAAAC